MIYIYTYDIYIYDICKHIHYTLNDIHGEFGGWEFMRIQHPIVPDLLQDLLRICVLSLFSSHQSTRNVV